MRFNLKLLLLMACAPGLVAAQGFDYNHVDAGYQSLGIKTPDVDASGLRLAGQWAFTPEWFGQARYSQSSTDPIAGGRFDSDFYSVGLGFRYALVPSVDLYGVAELAQSSYDGAGGTATGLEGDDTGFSLTGGLRWRAAPKIEINAGLEYLSLFDEDDAILAVTGVLDVAPQWAVLAGVTAADSATGLNLGVRWSFDALRAPAEPAPLRLKARQPEATAVAAPPPPVVAEPSGPAAQVAPAPAEPAVESPAATLPAPAQIKPGTTLLARPQSTATVLARIQNAAEFETLSTIRNAEGEWRFVRAAGKSGWVRASDLQ